jgi:hypothetical protein
MYDSIFISIIVSSKYALDMPSIGGYEELNYFEIDLFSLLKC